jgi:hypothetical protein
MEGRKLDHSDPTSLAAVTFRNDDGSDRQRIIHRRCRPGSNPVRLAARTEQRRDADLTR